MPLTDLESRTLAAIAASNSNNIQAAILAAYNAGLLEGALRAAAAMATTPAAAFAGNAGDDDMDDNPRTTGLTAAGKAALRQHGIDPDKPFVSRGTEYHIIDWRPSRYKFPVSAQNARGTRYKWAIATVIAGQKK